MQFIKKASHLHIFLVLLAIGIGTYINVFFNGFVGDDREQIYNYALVQGFFDLPQVFRYHHVVLESQSVLDSYYKPLMLLFFYATRLFFGVHPFFYHTPQVLLAITNSFLVFILFKSFFKKEFAFLLSVIFLIHPINQESVSYVSNIQDVLFFIFGISGLLVLQRAKKHKEIIISALLFLLALLSKETGILFVVISVFYLFLFDKPLLKKYFLVLPIVFIIYLVLRLSSQSTNVFWIEPNPMSQVSFQNRILHIPLLVFYYIKTFLFPDLLTFNQQWVIKQVTLQTFYVPLIVDVMGLSSLGIIIFRSLKKNYKKNLPLLFFAIWFVIGLLPHLQLLPLDATVADRWFYFSSVGILGMCGIGIEYLDVRFKNKTKFIFTLLIILILALSLRTFIRTIQWRDAFTLYKSDARLSESALIENNLGDEYFKRGDLKNARTHFQKALTLNPNLWIALNNLGVIEEQQGNIDQAQAYYRQALKKGDRLPIYENIARTLILSKKLKESKEFLEIAIKKYPLSAKLWLTLALTEYELGNFDAASTAAMKSYELLPDIKTQTVIDAIQQKQNTQ